MLETNSLVDNLIVDVEHGLTEIVETCVPKSLLDECCLIEDRVELGESTTQLLCHLVHSCL